MARPVRAKSCVPWYYCMISVANREIAPKIKINLCGSKTGSVPKFIDLLVHDHIGIFHHGDARVSQLESICNLTLIGCSFEEFKNSHFNRFLFCNVYEGMN